MLLNLICNIHWVPNLGISQNCLELVRYVYMQRKLKFFLLPTFLQSYAVQNLHQNVFMVHTSFPITTVSTKIYLSDRLGQPIIQQTIDIIVDVQMTSLMAYVYDIASGVQANVWLPIIALGVEFGTIFSWCFLYYFGIWSLYRDFGLKELWLKSCTRALHISGGMEEVLFRSWQVVPSKKQNG